MQPNRYRIASVDILRGIIMIIMALDHSREYFHITALTADPLDPATTTIPLYFTRWITHFCAPGFVLLSGLSAYLSSRNKARSTASAFLVKRGVWLIFVEIVIVTFGITFNPFYNFIVLQVIWAIGCSMILLGLLSSFSYKVVLVAGIAIVGGHNMLDYAKLPPDGIAGNLWTILLTSPGTVIPLSSTHFIMALYTILPWTGVMCLGFCMGKWFRKEFDAARRKRLLVITGVSLVGLFIVLRLVNGYGDPRSWSAAENGLLSFLNTTKYPPSLQYLAMTLGPSILLLALLEDVKAPWLHSLSAYGKVPFFYYILHFYMLHALAVIAFFISGHTTVEIVDAQGSPFWFRPLNFGYGLPVVYLAWAIVVTVLYLPCRWFGNYKITHRKWWLHYI
ncbi:heparan-alpha-glucosaminide N-acetyltransferase domain-containing protein [Agriterribacter sp.]|uniref:DUF1624 domain-containing protein n=1 Tax=Agriterribacter sp. TaxID=2821509 RepID=UPI002B927290|nr:heparan-alpha-glucosaminide N-acetyltransferase domain-containing protein [Agriterribacter sp.]HRP54998.1 heparan-alpha-glucosaminide N-acetyltransferase domain-containing protein [Agriterribacter sp.]